jgi:hypothetical protein
MATGPVDSSDMWSRFGRALQRLWIRFRGRDHLVVVDPHHDQQGSERLRAQGRFWAEFRAGQREADAHTSRSR